jgi:RNA polymerase sigma factor (sigma-70 family)
MDIAPVSNPKKPYPDAAKIKFESMDDYILHAHKIICYFAPRLRKGLREQIMSNEEAISNVATAIMLADWTFDREYVGEKGVKCSIRTYRNLRAIWAIKSFMTRRNRKSSKCLSLNNEINDRGVGACDAMQDDSCPSPQDSPEKKELREWLERVVDSALLSDKQSLYVRKRFFEDKTISEIAAESDVSRQAVGESINRAMRKIKESDFPNEYKRRFC